MIRFMGFVTGAAAAIAALLFLFGVPELVRGADESAPTESAPAVDAAPEPVAAADVPAGTPDADPAGAPPPEPVAATPIVEDVAPPPPADSAPPAVPGTPAETAAAGVPPDARPAAPPEEPAMATADGPTADFDIAVGNDPLAADLKWHAFWSPFRSRIAADGFVGRLEAVTGFDYRVVKMDSGVYEVAFAYASDDERLSKLEAIEAATGLEMPES